MQNKGAIRLFAILLALACFFYLSFTWVTRSVEEDAVEYGNSISESLKIKTAAGKFANGDPAKEKAFKDSVQNASVDYFLDSMKNQVVYDIFLTKYTYGECKEKEINLGLDLRGGMNVTLEVSVADIIKNLSNNNPDPVFNKAISETQKIYAQGTNKDFVSLFGDVFSKNNPNGRLAPYFQTIENKGRIEYNTGNKEVLAFIKERVDEAVANAKNTFDSRINRTGVSQPNIQQLEASGRIQIELPGVKDKERVRKLLQGTANLEFWETYENREIAPLFDQANQKIKAMAEPLDTNKLAVADTARKDSLLLTRKKLTGKELEKFIQDSIVSAKKQDSTKANLSLKDKLNAKDTSKKTTAKEDTSLANYKKNNPLYSMVGPLQPAIFNDGKQQFYSQGSIVGYARVKDTSFVNKYLADERIKGIFRRDCRFLWSAKAVERGSDVLALHAIKITDRTGKPALYGDIIADARRDADMTTGEIIINMTMTSEAAQTWRRLTASNAPKKQGDRGRCIAIVMDNVVYSAPTVNGEIPSGNSQISGDFDIKEADALVAILKSGKLPAPARIVEETVVGPTLGQESIRNGLLSFVIAFIVILVFMALYYNKAGWVANLALFINLFFIMGILTSLNAVLTLPGIAGIVLTIGLSVDANILIFERIREELALGKSIAQAIKEGFKHAMSSIIDSNVTLLILGIILYVFGSGPVQGFATTLCIGILSSLFAAVLLSRVVFETMLGRKMNISFDNNFTKNAFKDVAIDFVKRRKLYYSISAFVILLGFIFYFKNGGFNLGVDFEGGRSYMVRFGKEMNTEDVKNTLAKSFEGMTPEVKTAGSASQLKITTSYKINETGENIDKFMEETVLSGLKTLDKDADLVGSQKVGPTIATDILYSAYGAVLFSCLLMFVYIVIRFKKWQYGLGAVVALFHDVLVVLSFYTVFDGLLPFSLEIGQDFIAAILTVMGYTMTETVVVFDRIRERLEESGKTDVHGEERNKLINFALNSTLSRTILTSLTVFFVLLVIFIWGGDSIRGFIFALLIGRVIGTYSSLCISTPIVVDFEKEKKA